jgi:membrane protein YdbS with pleckstrin-like domain
VADPTENTGESCRPVAPAVPGVGRRYDMSGMDDDSVVATAEGGATELPAAEPAPPIARPPAPSETRRLDPQYVPLQRAVGWIVTAVVSACLLAIVGVFWLASHVLWIGLLLIPGWLVLTLGIGWLLYVWPAVHYRHVSYTLDEEGIEIRTGVWWRQVMSVPRSRVQHIDVSQGPMERSYGLGRLVLYTAGTNHSRVELGGLNHSVAFDLRNHLLPRGADDAV